MTRDDRWPFIPLVIVRSIQGLFAIIILAMTAYVVSAVNDANGDTPWWAAFGLVTALFTLIWVGITFTLLFMNKLLPLAVVIVDAFLLVFYLIPMAGTAASGVVGSDCTYAYYASDLYYYTSTSTPCMVSKGAFALELLSMFLFIATTGFASITLHTHRKDLRGAKHNQGLPPVSQHAGVEAGVMQPQYQEQKLDGTQQYYPPQQPTPVQQEQYVQGPPAPFVSPPTSPPPQEAIMGNQAAYSTVSTDYSSTAHEMPGTGYGLPPQQSVPLQHSGELPGTGYQQPPPPPVQPPTGPQYEMYGGQPVNRGELQGQ